MIKNKFQKIYKQIISQAPIFDTFEDDVINPKAVKVSSQYYVEELKDEKFFCNDITNVANNIGKQKSSLLYYYFKPLQIFDPYKSKDLNLLKIKTYQMAKFDTIRDVFGKTTYNASIGLHVSILKLQDFEVAKNLWPLNYFISHDVQDGYNDFIDYYNQDILADYSQDVQSYYEDKLNSKYEYDIAEGCILVLYAITDLNTGKPLYFDHDIYENKKFFPGNTPNNEQYLKRNFITYFGRSSMTDQIKNVLIQKLIEVKDNY